MNNNSDKFNMFFTRLVVLTAIALLVFMIILLGIGIASNASPAANLPKDTTHSPQTTETPDTTELPLSTKPADSANTPETTTPTETTAPITPNEYPNSIVNWEKFDSSPATLCKSEDMGMDYINKIIFLGDSTTNGLRAYGVLADGLNTKQVWTGKIGTLTLDNKIMNTKIYYPDMDKEVTIIEAVSDKKPEIIVITLGVNGISFSSEEQFKTNYTNLVLGIKNASPSTKIILQSLFPVTKSYDENPEKRIKNEKIRAANEWILSIAEENGLKFLNTTSVLQDANGCLIEEYCNDGELHLEKIGLLKELEYIRTHAYIN